MDAFLILVLILSVFLAIFLVLGIIFLVLSIRISIQIKRITDNVEDASDSLRSFFATLNRLANPAIIAKIVVKYIRNHLSGKRRNKDEQ